MADKREGPPSGPPGLGLGETGGAPEMGPARLSEAIAIQNLLAQQEEGSFHGIIGKLRELDSIDTPEEVEKAEKLLEQDYQMLAFSTLGHHLFVSNECLEYRNPYATWASKPGRDVLQSFLTHLESESLKIQLQEKSGKPVSPERKAWVRRMYSDFGWMKGSYAIQEGMGHLMKYYFSGPDGMSNALYEQRLNPLARDYRWAHRREDPEGVSPDDAVIPELTLTREQKEKSFGFTRVIKPEVKGPNGEIIQSEVTEKEGIRERAVRIQKDRFHFAVAVAEAGQINWDNVTLDSGGQIASFGKQDFEMKLTPDEVTLILSLFGEGSRTYNNKPVPERILNWFTMKAKDKNKLKYRALMEALILEDARGELARIGTLPSKDKKDALSLLSTRVSRRSSELRLKELDLSLEEKLARAVVRGGLVTDLGTGKSVKLGWGYEHGKQFFVRKLDGGLYRVSSDYAAKHPGQIAKTEENGREVVFAGIYTGKDDYTPGWPFHHDVVYDRRASKRGGLILPSSFNFREWAVKYPPTKWPDILWKKGGAVERDPELRKAFEYLFGSTPEAKKWAESVGLTLDAETIRLLKAMSWGWGTAWPGKDITPTPDMPNAKGEPSKHIIFASFIPREIQVIMFEQSMTFGGPKDANGNNLTLWEELMRGGQAGGPKDLDEINWLEMQTDAFDRWHVDMNMIGRVVSTLVDPLKKDVERSFYANPGGLKEMLKRLYLGLRDEHIKVNVGTEAKPEIVEVPGSLVWCAFASELIALYLSSTNDLISVAYDEGAAQINFVSGGQAWIKMENWMPSDIPEADVLYFNNTLAKMTWFHMYQLNRMGKEKDAGGDDRTSMNRAGKIVENIKK
jgi:hypothetical protein